MLRPLDNPPSRFDPRVIEWDEPPDLARLRVYADSSRSILSWNDSPDLHHRWSLNPYRGCMHACAYCYARSSHEYLGFGAGTDHDTKIVVKLDAPTLLEAAFDAPGWEGETLLFSGNTDCYQPVEARYRLTRACLEVCAAYRNPVTVITKSHLVERDLDVLQELARVAKVRVVVSIPFHDADAARAIEPGTPSPARRFEAVRRLVGAGIPVGVNLAPVIPGVNDRDIPRILHAARDAGADRAMMILVRLNGPVGDVFEHRLREAMPDRADGVLARLRRMRRGKVSGSTFGERMKGHGPEWEAIEQTFELWSSRLGFLPREREGDTTGSACDAATPTTFRRPDKAGAQLRLFS